MDGNSPVPERRMLLADIDRRVETVLELSARLDQDPDNQGVRERLDTSQRNLEKVYDIYEETLTRLPVSRCPLTGAQVTMVVDDAGLDGPFWDCERPIRPVQVFPNTVVALAGAMNLESFPLDLRHGVLPGPGRPYVVPRLLDVSGMKAVLSHLRIGDVDAYVTFYFHRDPLYEVARVNVWGTRFYIGELQEGCSYTLEVPDHPRDYDYDLAPRIESGGLFWIAPDDETLQLRSTVFDCPYLTVEGREFPVYCRNGFVESTLELSP